ncbi:MAG: CinA family nicotinamide mononucleotide deamidase-related protein [Balneolaceae bacterium]|nr:MAG: CinA family nicotinamide mononucleotide deamidase-related protein [Balneolaceae bacterium]
MQVHIITIGKELLIGDVVNTNASWIGQFFTEQGLECTRSVTVDDDAEAIVREVEFSLNSADITIMTGGLGPTHDDVTKHALCDYFGVELAEHEPSRAHIRHMFEKRGIPFSSSNLEQSMVPSNCEVLFNKKGTAPGMYFAVNGRVLAALPGVPLEMKHLIRDGLMPKLTTDFGLIPCYYCRYIQIAGIGESTLSDLNIGNITDYLNGRVSLAFLPGLQGITLRLSSYADTPEKARQAAMPLEEHIRSKAAEFIFSDLPEDTLQAAVGRLLAGKNRSLALAESCSGGLISSKITDVSGSSAYYMGGLCAYSNRAKIDLLGVDADVLNEHGAVSKPVALQMARGAARRFNADIGLSTTGVAGPGGGTPGKPVGTIWIGFWSADTHFAVKATLFKDRLVNKERSAIIALDILRRRLSGIDSFPYDLKPEFA